ncbi:SGNH/GDSL hydrolase family protein [Nocardioides sp. KR10-350]|uniref:SGNH/GDSL hydrolase family protein n=1 Tax=Nocardioides cheoyonin TaxID=3156615 RepID=UPI0032B49AFF
MSTLGSRYLRFAALGDSTTFGIGDPVPGGWRGWSRLLAQSLASSYDLSYCNVAVSGATAATVLSDQLADALAHRPDIATLMVGVNDVLRSGWDPARVRADLMSCAEALTGQGTLLLTARFHDHGGVWRLPEWLRLRLRRRLCELNAVWDEVHATYGGLRVDLGAQPEVWDRRFWSVDRIHPSELGHRYLARLFAAELRRAGLDFEPPSAGCEGGIPPSWWRDVTWIVAEGAPWVGRRARDFGPWAVRLALREVRPAGEPAPEAVALPR